MSSDSYQRDLTNLIQVRMYKRALLARLANNVGLTVKDREPYSVKLKEVEELLEEARGNPVLSGAYREAIERINTEGWSRFKGYDKPSVKRSDLKTSPKD